MEKDGQKRGRLEREIEREQKKMREARWRHMEDDEHIDKTKQKGNQTFINQQHVFRHIHRSFYRNEGDGIYADMSCRGSYASFRERVLMRMIMILSRCIRGVVAVSSFFEALC